MSKEQTDTRWTFDDRFMGKSVVKSRTLDKRIVARPDGLSTRDWYEFAGVVCKHLNAAPSPPEAQTAAEWRTIPHPHRPREAEYEVERLKKRLELTPGAAVETLTTWALMQPEHGSFAGALWAIAEYVAALSSQAQTTGGECNVVIEEAALRAGVDAGMNTAERLSSREMTHKFSDEYFAMAVSQDAAKAALRALKSGAPDA